MEFLLSAIQIGLQSVRTANVASEFGTHGEYLQASETARNFAQKVRLLGEHVRSSERRLEIMAELHKLEDAIAMLP